MLSELKLCPRMSHVAPTRLQTNQAQEPYFIIFFGVCLLINTKCLLYYNISVLIRAKRYCRSKTEKGTTWFQSWAGHSIQQDCCGKEQLGQLSIIAADIQTPALTYFPSIFV